MKNMYLKLLPVLGLVFATLTGCTDRSEVFANAPNKLKVQT
jgi:hypothetical protein